MSPSSSSSSRHWSALGVFLLLSVAIGAVGAALTLPSLPVWYANLTHPSFTPPNWAFAPVWTLLYLLMAIAAWLVWRATHHPRRDVGSALTRLAARKDAMALYAIQFGLNLAWTAAFFHLHRLLVAVAILVLLWFAVLSTAILFWRIKPAAGALMLPYLAWLSYGLALNLVFLRLN